MSQSTLQLVLSALNQKNEAIFAEKVTVTLNALGTFNIPANATYALVTVEGGGASNDGVRYWLTGVNPTATDGILRKDGSGFDIISRQNLLNFKAFGIGTNGAILQVQYYS